MFLNFCTVVGWLAKRTILFNIDIPVCYDKSIVCMLLVRTWTNRYGKHLFIFLHYNFIWLLFYSPRKRTIHKKSQIICIYNVLIECKSPHRAIQLRMVRTGLEFKKNALYRHDAHESTDGAASWSLHHFIETDVCVCKFYLL